MKILLFTYNFGGTSSGNITKKIAECLQLKDMEVTVVCGNYYGGSKIKNVITINPKPVKPARIFKFLGNFLGMELNYIFWEIRCLLYFSKINSISSPDIVYSRGSPICSGAVGLKFAKKYNKPLFVHFADPVPATSEWISSRIERLKLKNSVRPILKYASGISIVNKEMLEYQISQFDDIDFKNKSFIIPNPIPKPKYYGKISGQKIIFLFLGTFSDQRNPNLIINAFLQASKINRNIEFHIYGNNINTCAVKNYADKYENIKFFSPTENFREIFKKVNVLVDVDSIAENQVFLSGKLMEYLATDRFILSITTASSPAFKILSNLDCSSVVNHVEVQIVKAINRLAEKKWEISNFEKRKELIEDLSIEKILNKTIEALKITFSEQSK